MSINPFTSNVIVKRYPSIYYSLARSKKKIQLGTLKVHHVCLTQHSPDGLKFYSNIMFTISSSTKSYSFQASCVCYIYLISMSTTEL